MDGETTVPTGDESLPGGVEQMYAAEGIPKQSVSADSSAGGRQSVFPDQSADNVFNLIVTQIQ